MLLLLRCGKTIPHMLMVILKEELLHLLVLRAFFLGKHLLSVFGVNVGKLWRLWLCIQFLVLVELPHKFLLGGLHTT